MDGAHRTEFKSSKAMHKTICLSPLKRYKRSQWWNISCRARTFLKRDIKKKEAFPRQRDILHCLYRYPDYSVLKYLAGVIN